jgi:hypothetical protein
MSKPSLIRTIFPFTVRLGLALGALLLLAYVLAPILIKSYVERSFALGIDEIDLKWGHMELKKVASHDKTFQIRSLQIHVQPMDLLKGKLSAVTIDGLQAIPSVDPNEPLQIPNVMELLDELPMRVAQLDVTNISVTIPRSALMVEPIQFTGYIHGSLSGNNAHKLKSTILVHPNAHSRGGHLNIQLQDGKLSLDGSLNEIRLEHFPSAYTIKASATQTRGAPVFFEGEITDNNHEVYLAVKGESDTPKSGQLTFTIPSMEVNAQKIPLHLLGLQALDQVSDYSFTLSGKGSMIWTPLGIKPKGTLDVKEGRLTYDAMSLSGIHFHVPLEKIWPRASAKQDIHINSLTSPILDMSNVVMTFLLEDTHVVLSHASAQVWDGTAHMDTIHLSPLPSEQLFTLTLDAVSLQPLITHLKLSNASASGHLNGVLPIRFFSDGSFAVENGALKSSQQGHVSYKWDGALASEDSNLNLAGKVLQDLNYDEVDLRIKKKRHEEPVLELDIKGKNPKVLEGRNIDLRVNLSGKILQTLESAIQIFQADLKALRKQSRDGKKR